MPTPTQDETTKDSTSEAGEVRTPLLKSPFLNLEYRDLDVLKKKALRGPLFRNKRIATRSTFLALMVLSAVFGSMTGLMLIYSVDLPQMDDLQRYRPDTTTVLYDVRGREIGSFALERRVVVPYSEFPPVLRQAIISIEDKSFQRNWGVNTFRVIGAAYRDLHSKGRAQGASTLTMQLARNLFLTPERSFRRKIQEVLLTIQIERSFTKEQIFALYANQIYLGHGTYGFEAGAEFYFSKHAKQLTLPEAALLAALPKGPEYYSPVHYPARAIKRRNLVISEMLSDGKITKEQAKQARNAPLGLHIAIPPNSIAPWFVEDVRKQLELEYGSEEVHGAGLKVYTTLDLDLQKVANKAVLDGLAAYERRHGWKGNLQNVVKAGEDMESYHHPDWTTPALPGTYIHALVTQVAAQRVVLRIGTQTAVMKPEDWKWTGNTKADSFLHVGDMVYVKLDGQDGIDSPLPAQADTGELHAILEEDTGAQASLLAVDNANGEVLAMVGGRDFALSQFNRATQAQRQVGSSFKPYVYTAAIEAGAKPTDMIVDGPVSFPTASGPYTPHNYEGDYLGNISLLTAFKESRNIPALKLADRVGIHKVIEVAHRFGITSNIPPYLPVAIGSADITLYEQVGAYSVFPNDGIRFTPHYIRKVMTGDGLPLNDVDPQVQGVIDVPTARTMMTLLREVTRSGTGAAASQLNHPLGGKTGTTNDFTDAWFIGFSPSVTCGTWVGFDDRQTLGEKETGAKAALPIWMDFMRAAIADKPDEQFPSSAQPTKPVLEAPPVPGAPNSPTLANPQKSPEDANSADTDSGPEAELPDAQPSAADTGAKPGDTPQSGSAATPDDAAKPAPAKPDGAQAKPNSTTTPAKPAAPANDGRSGFSRPSDSDESTAAPAARPAQSAPARQQP